MGCSASSHVTGGSTPASGPKETPPVQVASKTPPPTVDPAQPAQENPQPEIVREHHKDEQTQVKEVALDDPQNSAAEPREDPLGEESREGFNETQPQVTEEMPPQVAERTEVDNNKEGSQAEKENAVKNTEIEKHEEARAIEESAAVEPQQKPQPIEGEEGRAEETTKQTSPGDASDEEKPEEIQEGRLSEERLVDENKQDGVVTQTPEQNNDEHDEPEQVEIANKSVGLSKTAEKEEPQQIQQQNEEAQNSEDLKPEEETPASQTAE